MTGQKSDIYTATKSKIKNCKLYKPGEYGYVGANAQIMKAKISPRRNKDVVEVNNIYDKDSELQKMLDKYEGKESDYAITVCVNVAKDGPDGNTKAGGAHALTVSKITEDYVEVINPWDTAKKERIPRDDFEQMAIGLEIAPMNGKKLQEISPYTPPTRNIIPELPIPKFLQDAAYNFGKMIAGVYKFLYPNSIH